MANGDIEKYALGAPKMEPDLEKQIRYEIDRDFPALTDLEKDALVRSRIRISSPARPTFTKVDLGEEASKKVKEDLFE